MPSLWESVPAIVLPFPPAFSHSADYGRPLPRTRPPCGSLGSVQPFQAAGRSDIPAAGVPRRNALSEEGSWVGMVQPNRYGANSGVTMGGDQHAKPPPQAGKSIGLPICFLAFRRVYLPQCRPADRGQVFLSGSVFSPTQRYPQSTDSRLLRCFPLCRC
jgi:hypothetical protein